MLSTIQDAIHGSVETGHTDRIAAPPKTASERTYCDNAKLTRFLVQRGSLPSKARWYKKRFF